MSMKIPLIFEDMIDNNCAFFCLKVEMFISIIKAREKSQPGRTCLEHCVNTWSQRCLTAAKTYQNLEQKQTFRPFSFFPKKSQNLCWRLTN